MYLTVGCWGDAQLFVEMFDVFLYENRIKVWIINSMPCS